MTNWWVSMKNCGMWGSPPEISILLVSYNTRNLTLEAIRSVFRETNPELIELIVVDNASSDSSAEAIATEFPEVKLHALETNVGFAAANNLAAVGAKGRYLLLLNPDTIILNDAIGQLHRFAKDHTDARLWGGRTLFGDGSLNPTSCWNKMTAWSTFCLMTGLKALLPNSSLFNSEAICGWDRDSIARVDIVSGCFLMIENSLWRQLHGFDLTYFMYGEDADLCLRARLAGARPTICPDAEIVHYGGASERVRAEKMKRLLKAKTTLMHRHWNRVSRTLGHVIFWAFPLPRIAGYKMASMTRGRSTDSANVATWIDVWQSRVDWLSGYPRVEGDNP